MTKKAIVTGGAQGIGAELVAALIEADYEVGIIDIDSDALAEIAKRCKGVTPLPADVGNRAEVEAAFREFGSLDLLVNNAGIVRFGPLIDQTQDDIQAVISVNLMGSMLCAQQAAKRMQDIGGVILNMSSVNAVHPAPTVGLYAATKAAIANLTQLQALEWGPLGIRVNAIAPGFIDAGMSAPIFADEKVRAKRSGGVPLHRLGTAADVISAVLYLASDAAAYIHGHELVIDGGVINSVLAHLPRD